MQRPGEFAQHVSLFWGAMFCTIAGIVFLTSLPSPTAVADGSLLSMWALSSLAVLAAVAGTGITFLKMRLP